MNIIFFFFYFNKTLSLAFFLLGNISLIGLVLIVENYTISALRNYVQ